MNLSILQVTENINITVVVILAACLFSICCFIAAFIVWCAAEPQDPVPVRSPIYFLMGLVCFNIALTLLGTMAILEAIQCQ